MTEQSSNSQTMNDDLDWATATAEPTTHREMPTLRRFKCPKCGARAYDGDPTTGRKFRGSAKCVKCGNSFSVAGPAPASIEENWIASLIERKVVTVDDFDRLINESLPKSVDEREIYRPVRTGKIGPKIRRPAGKVQHAISRHSDTDPTKTSRGRSALRKRGEYNKEHPDLFKEAVEFIKLNNGKQYNLDSVSRPDLLKKLALRLCREPNHGLDQDWLYGLATGIHE